MIVEIKSEHGDQRLLVNTDNIETVYSLNDNCCKIEFISGKTLTVNLPYDKLMSFFIVNNSKQVLYS